jgi:hypothetical protein
MTAQEHNKTLATLYFIYSGIHGLTLIGLLLLLLIVKFSTPAAALISTSALVIGSVIFVLLFLAVGLLPLIVAFGLRRRARWVKPLANVVAVLSIVNIPIGTALGIYTIKFFRSAEGRAIYGGSSDAAATNSEPLNEATHGTEPLMNWADRLKRGEQ